LSGQIQLFNVVILSRHASLPVDVLAVAPGPVKSGFGARAKMNMSLAQTPEEVASGALRALGKGNLVRPGFLAKFLEYALALLPRSHRVSIMERVMGSMTNRHAAKPLSLGK
jgi:short-subunit dehydrogenase